MAQCGASRTSAEFGAIAQLGERLHGMQEVGGSIPPGSTSRRRGQLLSRILPTCFRRSRIQDLTPSALHEWVV